MRLFEKCHKRPFCKPVYPIVNDVCDAYAGWRRDFVKNELFSVRKDFFIAAIVFAPCFLIVFFRRRIVDTIRTVRVRKRRTYTDDPDPTDQTGALR